ncbi:hypothetical protein AGMMS49940_24770 [Spirochaetia bacterium]|nr:hypothetical protein AGMMS49940_24770 [Spirochaetia bacterium]
MRKAGRYLTTAILLFTAILSSCDIFNKPIEPFIHEETGEVRVLGIDQDTIPPGDSTVTVTLENSQGYSLQVSALNDGQAAGSAEVRAEVSAVDRIALYFNGAEAGDTFNLSLKIWIDGRNRVFDDLVIPLITCTDSTALAEVSGLTATAGDGSVVLTWIDPADSDFDHVVITYTNGTAQSVDVDTEIETATITGLTNGTMYTFIVQTVDTIGNTSTGNSNSMR